MKRKTKKRIRSVEEDWKDAGRKADRGWARIKRDHLRDMLIPGWRANPAFAQATGEIVTSPVRVQHPDFPGVTFSDPHPLRYDDTSGPRLTPPPKSS